MANFTGTSGADTFVGTSAEADFFSYAVADLDAAGNDIVNGLDGSFVDVLTLTTAGVITATMLNNVTRIEEVRLTGISTLNLSAAFINSAGATLTVVGGDGAQVLVTNSLAGNRLIFNAGGGADQLMGGAGSEEFRFVGAATGDLGAGNDAVVLGGLATISGVVAGGDGVDTITLGRGGVWSLAGYTGFERLIMTGATTVTLSARDGFEAVGSKGNDTITLATTGQAVQAGFGDDVVHLTAGSFAGAFLLGGGQKTEDVLVIDGGSAVFDFRTAAVVRGFERIEVNATGATILLNNQAVEVHLNSAVGNTLTTGNTAGQQIFGSLSNDVITSTTAGQVIDGSFGDDVFTTSFANIIGGTIIRGGAGADTLQLTDGGVINLTRAYHFQSGSPD